jgi:hypothetical protein
VIRPCEQRYACRKQRRQRDRGKRDDDLESGVDAKPNDVCVQRAVSQTLLDTTRDPRSEGQTAHERRE